MDPTLRCASPSAPRRPTRAAALHATNLLDSKFETFGTYAQNGRAGGAVEPFLTPGAPLRVFANLRWALD